RAGMALQAGGGGHRTSRLALVARRIVGEERVRFERRRRFAALVEDARRDADDGGGIQPTREQRRDGPVGPEPRRYGLAEQCAEPLGELVRRPVVEPTFGIGSPIPAPA